MDQQFYRSLLLLVNTIQGSLAELRRFKTLRDEVVKGAE